MLYSCMRKMRWVSIILMAAVVCLGFGAGELSAAGGVTLYTPYTDISVTPGTTIKYTIDVINDSGSVQNVALRLEDNGAGWEYGLTSGGWKIGQISVKPNDSQQVNMELNVPLQIDKGDYQFVLTADGLASLPLTVRVSEQGTYQTELTTEQPNMEGHAESSFSFSYTLRNRTAEKQDYALTTQAPRGWNVQFNADGKSVTSVTVEPGESKSLTVEVKPPANVQEGSYKIPISAANGNTEAKSEMEVVITGTYKVSLSTESGLLSTEVTAGSSRKLDLKVTNEGTADLTDLQLSAQAPVNWEVTFEPKTITKLEAGQSTTVTAELKADKKAVAGDYVTNMKVTAPEASSDASFRVAVKASVLWGWIGVLIIAAVIAGIYYLFRTYGRR
ncbi:NPCBM-associated, NEW3 domain of alpha-galactosidase [Chlamydia abortus]|nr:NPCBM-associated, NEW3 domain of alpha-galactosidase [Chlamydia abortus]